MKLIHGDCLEVMKTIPDESVDMVLADAPYGARRPSARRKDAEQFDEISGNDGVCGAWLVGAERVLKEGGAVYVFVCWDRLGEWQEKMVEAGLRARSCIVWDKVVHGLADLRTCWAPQYEMILFAAKGRHTLRGTRPKDILTVQRVDPLKLVHPYEKPMSLISMLIKASSDKGQTVLDPFMGSGTTGVAAIKTGREFIGIEIDRGYFDIAKRRIERASQRKGFFQE